MAVLALWVVFFVTWPAYFGEYKDCFCSGFLWQNFYLLVVVYRVLLSLFMVFLGETVGGAVMTFLLTMAWSVLHIIFRPYK